MTALRLSLILALVFLPTGPFATTFPVTKTADTNGNCTPGDCSLREAIGAANSNVGADDVPVPAGTYLLTLGRLVVSDDVTITGAGQESTIIDGNWSDGVFEIQASVLAEISGFTIQKGFHSAGGGIHNQGDLTLTNSTVSGNDEGICNHDGRVATLTNTIVAGNSANCSGPDITSLGYNLADDTSCGFSATGDLVVADAMLGPLQDNGGPTETHDLLPGSLAIDAGGSCPPPTTDQRGVVRPQGVACDIGAVEFVPEPEGWLMLVAGAAFLGLLYRRRARRLRFG
jgi:CSLREA domain-containing protein